MSVGIGSRRHTGWRVSKDLTARCQVALAVALPDQVSFNPERGSTAARQTRHRYTSKTQQFPEGRLLSRS